MAKTAVKDLQNKFVSTRLKQDSLDLLQRRRCTLSFPDINIHDESSQPDSVLASNNGMGVDARTELN
jgi:hypothetical protein